jgi:DNA-binding transcriptional LysR family regulator
MLEQLDTLIALVDSGTMTRAATRLRITQSAVSKRVSLLEASLQVRLIERQGRRVVLTADGHELVARARPIVAELKQALSGKHEEAVGMLSLGVSESILTSWGARVLARVGETLPKLNLVLRAHRSPVAVDGVLAGELSCALVAGEVTASEGLWCEHLADEELVLIGRGRTRLPTRGRLEVLSIERASATFRALRGQLVKLRERGLTLEISRELGSFAALAQLSRAGFGTALVPKPLAEALGTTSAEMRSLPGGGLWRPISLVGRKTTFARTHVAAFRESVHRELGDERALRTTGGARPRRT